jgi:hypothetical protein
MRPWRAQHFNRTPESNSVTFSTALAKSQDSALTCSSLLCCSNKPWASAEIAWTERNPGKIAFRPPLRASFLDINTIFWDWIHVDSPSIAQFAGFCVLLVVHDTSIIFKMKLLTLRKTDREVLGAQYILKGSARVSQRAEKLTAFGCHTDYPSGLRTVGQPHCTDTFSWISPALYLSETHVLHSKRLAVTSGGVVSAPKWNRGTSHLPIRLCRG